MATREPRTKNIIMFIDDVNISVTISIYSKKKLVKTSTIIEVL